MLAAERLLQIEAAFANLVARIVVVELDGETLRLVIYLRDGSNLLVTEQWFGKKLKRYSYYWFSRENLLKIGWDNAPHHTWLHNFPHHKHARGERHPESSTQSSLEDVMAVILSSRIAGTP